MILRSEIADNSIDNQSLNRLARGARSASRNLFSEARDKRTIAAAALGSGNRSSSALPKGSPYREQRTRAQLDKRSRPKAAPRLRKILGFCESIIDQSSREQMALLALCSIDD